MLSQTSAQTIPQTGVARTPPPSNNIKGAVTNTRRALGALIYNAKLMIDLMTWSTIERSIQDDLRLRNLLPDKEVHIYFVRVFGNDSGYRTVHSYRYLAKGNTEEEALLNSFLSSDSPDASAIMEVAAPSGSVEYNGYVTAVPHQDRFEIRGQNYSRGYYENVRANGLVRREEAQTERKRIDALRAAAVAKHKASEPVARKQLAQHRKARKEHKAAVRDSRSVGAPTSSTQIHPEPGFYMEPLPR
jgi:hypothetical protein